MQTTNLQPTVTAFARVIVSLQCALLAALLLFAALYPLSAMAQQGKSTNSQLTPFQLEVENQRRRLSSSETEERRDAVMRLGSMRRPESSRVAATGLRDSAAIVRATATRAVLSVPADEAAALLLPLLRDRDEFVRQETSYALGETRSLKAVNALQAILELDKKDSVRGAAAVALGQIGDESAVMSLVQLLGRRVPASGLINRVRRSKRDENEFVRRAAAHSLGEIRSRAAIPELTAVALDERVPDDIRREAATALSLIGDQRSVAAFRALLTARDPYLSRIAYLALIKLAPAEATRPTDVVNPR